MRKPQGYALVTVLVIGLFSMAFLMALAGIITSAARVTAENKWSESLRNAAEIGIDYAVNQYNSLPGGLDPPSATLASSTTILPDIYLQSANNNSGVPNVSVSITASRILNADVTDWTLLQGMSSIYSPYLDPTRTVSSYSTPVTPSALTAPGGGYRIITSTASNNIISKTIQVVLKARFDTPPSGSPLALGGSTPNQSLFSTPLFSNGAINLQSSSLNVQGYNSQTGQQNTVHTTLSGTVSYSAYDLNVSTNTSASVQAGNTLKGDLTIASNSSTSNTVVQAPGTVDGRVTSNGIISTEIVAPAGATAPSASSANVLANADTVAAGSPAAPRQGLNASNPTAISNATSQIAQTLEAPVPSSANSTSLASLSAVNTPIQGANATLGESGNYGTIGLSTSGVLASQPVIIANANSPVTFFVQDSGTGQAVNLDTQLLNSQNNGGDPRNLQIYYQGTDTVTINVGSNGFTGLIYAPNAPVYITGNGTFNGGIAGGSVKVDLVGQMNLATDLSVSSASAPPSGWTTLMPGQANAYAANSKAFLEYQMGPNGPVIQGWQPVTWQEF